MELTHSLWDDFEQPLKKRKQTVPRDKLQAFVGKEDASESDKSWEPGGKEDAEVDKQSVNPCDYCPSIFLVKSNYTRHEAHSSAANKDKEANGFIIDKCSTCYSRKENLTAHLNKCTEKSF